MHSIKEIKIPLKYNALQQKALQTSVQVKKENFAKRPLYAQNSQQLFQEQTTSLSDQLIRAKYDPSSGEHRSECAAKLWQHTLYFSLSS